MMQSPPVLPSADGPQNWKSLQTEVSLGWVASILFVSVFLVFMIGSGGFIILLGRGSPDPWQGALFMGGGALMVICAIWTPLWTSQHGSFNFDVNPKTKRIRKWKTSLFLKRSYEEYAYDDFRAVRSVQRRDDEVYCVVVELLFKATKPALEVARFNARGCGASYWQRCVSTLRGLRCESPRGVALRRELVRLLGVNDAGYFDKD